MISCSASTSSSFLIVSYNILAQSLGSNCIPWVTRISDDWMERLNNGISSSPSSPNDNKTSWTDIKSALRAEYKAHFHKNPNTQSDPKSYHHMRHLWSTKSLTSPEELKRFHPNLDCVTFESEWKVSYKKKKSRDEKNGEGNDGDEEGERCVATTLRGVLHRELGNELGSELFEHLMELEENVYDWKKSRGPKIFRRITSNWTTMMARSEEKEENDDSESCRSSVHPVDVGVPSIICLQEYDVHHMEAVYRSHDDVKAAAEEETFSQAMKVMGYDGIFFPGASGKSGLATFWKQDEFELDMDQNNKDEDRKESNLPDTILLGTNWKQVAFNCDLMEHYHDRTKHPSQQHPMTLLTELDRKNVGFVRLKHILTNRILWVFNTHFMTTSRDNERLTFYPGEIRARELETVSEMVLNHVNRGDGIEDVIMAGDWNTDVGDFDVFKGCIPYSASSWWPSSSSSLGEKNNGKRFMLPPSLNIPTGFSVGEGANGFSQNSQLNWKSSCGRGAILNDAFESVHCRKSHTINPAINDRKKLGHHFHATSHNSDRREWIDHIWYSGGVETHRRSVDADKMEGVSEKYDREEKQYLKVKALSHTKLPWRPIPDLEEPSDHIPIGVEFKFVKM